VVVDTEEDVAFGVAGGEERTRHDLARVACLENAQLQSTLVLERLLHSRRDGEEIVRDQDDLVRLAAPAAPRRGERRDHEERAESGAKRLHLIPPGRIASRAPRSTETRALVSVKTLDTPRVEPGSSVSPRSG